MNLDKNDNSVQAILRHELRGGSNDPTRSPPRWWRLIAILVAIGIFGEAIFAGAMLSGVPWAQTAHALNAKLLIAATIVAALAAIVALRDVANRTKHLWILLALAALVVVQSAFGALSAKGMNLLWVHTPLGVALFAFAVHIAINFAPRRSEST